MTTPSQAGQVVWPLTDNLGSVRDLAVYNAATGTTTVVNHRVYDSFGNLLSQTNPATGSAAALDCLFGFTGQMFDPSTGLQYNRLRWYDPRLSRFVSQDPSEFTYGDANPYRYVGNSPLDYTDPWGLHENPQPTTGTPAQNSTGQLTIDEKGNVVPYDPIGDQIKAATNKPPGSRIGPIVITPPPEGSGGPNEFWPWLQQWGKNIGTETGKNIIFQTFPKLGSEIGDIIKDWPPFLKDPITRNLPGPANPNPPAKK